jgi:large subunit ribosomal protein L23
LPYFFCKEAFKSRKSFIPIGFSEYWAAFFLLNFIANRRPGTGPELGCLLAVALIDFLLLIAQ